MMYAISAKGEKYLKRFEKLQYGTTEGVHRAGSLKKPKSLKHPSRRARFPSRTWLFSQW